MKKDTFLRALKRAHGHWSRSQIFHEKVCKQFFFVLWIMNIKLQVKPKKFKGNHVPMEIYESGLDKIIANGLKFDVESTSLFVLNLKFYFQSKDPKFLSNIQSFYQISN